MQISIVTDEISADLETAVELGVEWGVRDFELRTYNTQRVPLLTDFQKQRIHELIDEYDLHIVALSPGLFKIPYQSGERERFSLQALDAALYARWQDARDQVQYHLDELLPATLDYARELGVTRIVAFSFDRGSSSPGLPPDEILAALRRAAELTHQAGMQLLLEVESGFWADTGQRTAALVQAVNHAALAVNWDPGNAYVAGDTPYPDGYQAVRPSVRHVHFKDVARDPTGGHRYVIEGEIDWAGQIRALAADNYAGYISIETHMQPKVRSAKAMLERLRTLIDSAG